MQGREITNESEFQQIDNYMKEHNISRQEVCEIITKREPYHSLVDIDMLVEICENPSKWMNTDAEEFIWQTICRCYYVKSIIQRLIPISEQTILTKAYYHNGNACVSDITQGDIIWIESEFEGRYGKQFWFGRNNHFELNALPSRKQLIEKLEVGKFYKVTKASEQHFGNGRKRYNYDFEEVTEEDYIQSIRVWR